MTTEETRIHALIDKVERENRFVEELNSNNLTNLPVGIKKTISNVTITIAIDSATLFPGGMIINAYSRFLLPGSQTYLTFELKGAVITPAGLSMAGPTRLVLITNKKIRFNDQITLGLAADERNYIDWDCNGFRSVSLSGLFEFSDFFIPDDTVSSVVTAGFEVNTSDLNNILVSTSITPFRLKGMSNMSFAVRNATIDMSDFVNCEGFVMPQDYQMIFPDAPQLWRGFFLKEVTVKLPSELGSGSTRTEISARDLLIDDFGISGRLSATNVLSIDNGEASGWPFSINSLEIGLIQNKLVAGNIEGLMKVPFLGDEPLGYMAQIMNYNNDLNYTFAIKTTAEKEYPCPFGGTVRLDKSCVFSMKKFNGKFIPSAILNGAFNLSSETTELKGIRFEQLYLIAESPYIKGGKFESPGGTGFKLAGFGLSVDSISLAFTSGRASLRLNTKVALTGRNEKGISASTRFYMNASMKKEPGTGGGDRLKWTYDGIVLEDVKVKGNVSLFTLSGNVAIYNDHPVYGDACMGKVAFTAGKIIKDTTRVEVIFGNKPDFRYWYVKVDIPTNIMIGTVTLSHIGGGAYSNMERTNVTSTNFSNLSSDYLPVKDAGIGFMADVGLYVKNKKIFNADAMLEIAVNSTGGVRFIRFAGEGRFFSPDDDKQPSVKASLSMTYSNEYDSFHANLQVYMNIANAVRGIGPNDLLGEAVIHSDPKDWYVFIGRPSSPLGVDVLGLITTQTYFMAGTKIESMPLPPSEVSKLIPDLKADFLANESGFKTGRGVAFGIRFNASAGVGEKKGFVYATFSAGAGADIMLQDFGTATCLGRSGPIGINGWYASGQGYAYLLGRIGIRVKGSEFDIMSVAAALLVQAKMPNPSWFSGNIAARYSVLGGLVKGKVNVKVVLGEECVLVTNGNELGGIELIGDISPTTGSKEVDVFTAPQVSFNTTINKEFGMVNLNDDYAVYRVILDEFKLFSADKTEIPGTTKLNPAGDMATFEFNNVLPGRQQINLSVKVHVEKKSPTGWEILAGNKEAKTVSFGTGDEPKSIPASNVAYSYPLRDQYNFYRSEYSKGYIKLKNGLVNLFKPVSDGITWKYLARFKSDNQVLETNVSYDDPGKTVSFDIPANLVNSKIYELIILKKPVGSGSIDDNLSRNQVNLTTKDPEDSLSIATTDITATKIGETETVLHSFSFRSSDYSTFSEKISAIKDWDDQFSIDDFREVKTYMSLLYVKGNLGELFDNYEIRGNESVKPLVSIEALPNTAWITSHAYPLIYELYGTTSITLNRDVSDLGLFPSRAVFIQNLITQDLNISGSISSQANGDFYFKYYVPAYVNYDFYELRDKAATIYIGSSSVPEQAVRLLAGTIKNLPEGEYPFRINYRLPGDKVTYSKDFVFKHYWGK